MRDRAVSTPLAYVLNLGIATILVTGIIIGGTAFIDERRETVVRTELKVIGQQIAADVQHGDRLVQAQPPGTKVSIEQQYPTRVAGSTYSVTLAETSSPHRQFVNLTTEDGNEVTVSVRVPTETDIQPGSYTGGGSVAVVFADVDADSARDALVIRNAS